MGLYGFRKGPRTFSKEKDALWNIHAKQSLISSYNHTDTNALVKHTPNSKNKSSLKLHLKSHPWSEALRTHTPVFNFYTRQSLDRVTSWLCDTEVNKFIKLPDEVRNNPLIVLEIWHHVLPLLICLTKKGKKSW